MTLYLLFLLVAAICFIVWTTAYKKLNAFFALTLAAVLVGIASGLPLQVIASTLKAGFGHTMEKIGLLIILGTTLGVLLEKTGATASMAGAILRAVSEKHAPAAIAITGFIIGFPIFCDSGFIILSGLNHSLVRKTHFRMPVMAAVLASSLYAVHCLVPPHPGITAAVGSVGGDLGMVMLWGLAISVPVAAAGYFWSLRKGLGITDVSPAESSEPEKEEEHSLPPPFYSFLPVFLPIGLIALKSIVFLFTSPETNDSWLLKIIAFLGEPVIALGAGIIPALGLVRKNHKKEINHWLTDGVDKAGMILAIIAAGGMFGEMLQTSGTGKSLGTLLSGYSSGIFLPFLIAAVLKTAQGSSTVAVITAASLLTPMLPSLGLDHPTGQVLAILSMGAGSMVVSHANDAYFWVISRFSGLETATTLKVYSTATLIMGLTAQAIIWFLFVIFG